LKIFFILILIFRKNNINIIKNNNDTDLELPIELERGDSYFKQLHYHVCKFMGSTHLIYGYLFLDTMRPSTINKHFFFEIIFKVLDSHD
jgi:hypothetical protein